MNQMMMMMMKKMKNEVDEVEVFSFTGALDNLANIAIELLVIYGV